MSSVHDTKVMLRIYRTIEFENTSVERDAVMDLQSSEPLHTRNLNGEDIVTFKKFSSKRLKHSQADLSSYCSIGDKKLKFRYRKLER